MLTLLALALLGQTWEWTDSHGLTHFTDDRSTIPRGAKVKQTEGVELFTVTPSGPVKPAVVKRAAPKPAGVDRCELGRKKVEQLEASLVKAEKDRLLNETAYRNNCGSLAPADQAACEALLPHYRACGRTAPAPTFPLLTRTQADLERAREELRKAQMDGC